MHGLTHEQFLGESADTVDWVLAFHRMENEMQKAEQERRARAR